MASVEQVVGSDVVLFWLDDHIGRAENCRQLKQEFETNTTFIHAFHDVRHCTQFVEAVGSKKLFGIVQGKYAETIVPDIERCAKAPFVYIFCFDILRLNEWAQDQQCIMNGGMFDHEADLLAKFTKDLADYAQSKAAEYNIKRKACEEWAENLTQRAKRLRHEQCTLPFQTDPFSDQETQCEQSE